VNRILYLGNNSSATGNRGSFPGINDLIILIFITCCAFCEKCAAVFFYSYLAHVGDVVFKDSSHVDKNNWKKGCASNAYLPKQNPKDRQLKKDWEELRSKSIQRFELDKIVGGKDPFHMCGFDYSSEDYFFIITNKPEKFDFPFDVIEISNLEYLELTKQK